LSFQLLFWYRVSLNPISKIANNEITLLIQIYCQNYSKVMPARFHHFLNFQLLILFFAIVVFEYWGIVNNLAYAFFFICWKPNIVTPKEFLHNICINKLLIINQIPGLGQLHGTVPWVSVFLECLKVCLESPSAVHNLKIEFCTVNTCVFAIFNRDPIIFAY
jgi:hypothetical protein